MAKRRTFLVTDLAETQEIPLDLLASLREECTYEEIDVTEVLEEEHES